MSIRDIFGDNPDDDADPHAVEVTIEDGTIEAPPAESDGIDVTEIDDIEGTIAMFRELADATQVAIDGLEAEMARRERREALEPFDLPHDWTYRGAAYGDDLIDTAVDLRRALRNWGTATTDDLYLRYRRQVPRHIVARTKFGVRVVPVLADADGVNYRGWRVDADAALSDSDLDAAVADLTFQHGYGGDILAAAYRELRDGPAHGLPRLGLKHAAANRANAAVGDKFFGPDDPDDWAFDIREKAEGLAALLDLEGVEPPAEPAWKFTGGNPDND